VSERTYKHWIGIDCNNPFLRTLRKCRQLGMQIINGGKPGFCAWYGLCVRATADQMKELQDWWDLVGIRWYRRQPSGAWSVSDQGEPIPWKEALKNAMVSR
jgi:hypothetical protein